MLCGSFATVQAQDWTQNPFAPDARQIAAVPAVDWHQPLFSIDEIQAEQLALAKAVKEGLRPIYVWSMDANCPPCQKLERDKREDAKTIIKAGLVMVDGPKTFPAVKPELVPTFRWQDIKGGWRIHTGWTNTRDFLSIVENTDKAAERSAQAALRTPAKATTETTTSQADPSPASLVGVSGG